MQRIFLAFTVLASGIAHDRPAHAVVVECANCADLVTQLYQKAQSAQSLLNQVAQLKTELNQYANMVTNTVALPMQVFANVQQDIMQVRSLANAASLLRGNSGSILNRLQSAQGYANQAGSLPQDLGNQFTMWQTTLGNAGVTLGRTLGVQQGQENNYTALQTAIQAHSQTAAGQMQAIQAGTEMAALTNTQLNQLQTTLTAIGTEQATRDAVLAERQAIEDQNTVKFFSQADANISGWPRY